MTIIRTLWYLVGLFTLASICTSAISVAPGGERAMAILTIILLSLAVCTAVGALLLRRLHCRRPEAVVFTSKLLARLAVSVAVFLTIIVFLGVIG